MRRTSRRPLPAGSVKPLNVLIYGLSFSILSVVVTWLFVNITTALLTASAILIYVVAYTMLSKRRTPLATFIGGVGGALPPVIGYAAVNPALDIYALTLFLIIFAWQHPHFWSLALKYVNEYRAANVQNLPVVRGVKETKKQITLWAGILAMVSLAPYFLGMSGGYYLATAIAFGAVHLLMSINFLLSDRKVAMSLFFYSIIQLPALFCVMLIDIV
jgi:protoheme IX farnesyltransferase